MLSPREHMETAERLVSEAQDAVQTGSPGGPVPSEVFAWAKLASIHHLIAATQLEHGMPWSGFGT